MRSEFLLQQADADEELAVVPKWLIQTLKDSGMTKFTSWIDTGPRTRFRHHTVCPSAIADSIFLVVFDQGSQGGGVCLTASQQCGTLEEGIQLQVV